MHLLINCTLVVSVFSSAYITHNAVYYKIDCLPISFEQYLVYTPERNRVYNTAVIVIVYHIIHIKLSIPLLKSIELPAILI